MKEVFVGILLKWNGLKWFHIPWFREILEAVLGLGLTFLAGWYTPGSWASSHLVFCMVFLVVFAMAIRYHAVVAYFSSLLAAIGYALLLWLRPDLHAQFTLPRIIFESFLLLISGILASDLLHAERRRFHALRQEHAQMEDRLQKTIRRYQTALEVNLELERQVSGQPALIATISDQMMHLWLLDGKERYSAVLELLMHAIDVQSCALYLRRNGLMQLCASRSIDESAHLIILNLDDPLIRRVILHHQVSTVRDSLSSSESVSQKTALMAGPLFDRSKRVVGIVVVDSMPLLKFTPSAVRLFSSLLQMVSISLQTEGSGPDTERLRSLDWNDLDSERSKLTVPVLQTSQGVFPE